MCQRSAIHLATKVPDIFLIGGAKRLYLITLTDAPFLGGGLRWPNGPWPGEKTPYFTAKTGHMARHSIWPSDRIGLRWRRGSRESDALTLARWECLMWGTLATCPAARPGTEKTFSRVGRIGNPSYMTTQPSAQAAKKRLAAASKNATHRRAPERLAAKRRVKHALRAGRPPQSRPNRIPDPGRAPGVCLTAPGAIRFSLLRGGRARLLLQGRAVGRRRPESRTDDECPQRDRCNPAELHRLHLQTDRSTEGEGRESIAIRKGDRTLGLSQGTRTYAAYWRSPVPFSYVAWSRAVTPVRQQGACRKGLTRAFRCKTKGAEGLRQFWRSRAVCACAWTVNFR